MNLFNKWPVVSTMKWGIELYTWACLNGMLEHNQGKQKAKLQNKCQRKFVSIQLIEWDADNSSVVPLLTEHANH